MFIKYLELYNYKRLKKKGINRITLTFTEIVQIIIGMNGGGKSSLMREASPMPPSNDDYGTGGYKFVVVEHNKSTYELHSTTGSPSRHSFIKDGEELNESKTLNAQKILVRDHFGLTQELLDMLLGMVYGVSFTTMTPAKRREWLMNLYPNDLSFGAKLHNYFKTQYRDMKGGIKLGSKRLSELVSQKDASTTPEQMAVQLSGMQTAKDRIARLVNDNLSPRNYQHDIDEGVGNIKQWVSDYYDQVIKFTESHTSRDDILSKIEYCKSELSKLNYAHKTHMAELAELAKNNVFTGDNVEEEREAAKTRLLVLQEELGRVTEKQLEAGKSLIGCDLLGVVDSLEADVAHQFHQVANELLSVLMDMKDNPDHTVSISQYEKVQSLMYNLKAKVEQLDRDIETKQHRLKHIQQSDKTQCPSCKYEWIPGVTPQAVDSLSMELATLIEEHKQSNERLTKCVDYISKNTQWYEQACRFIRFTSQHTALSPVFEWMLANDVLHTAHHAIAMHVPAVSNMVGYKSSCDALESQIEQVSNRIKLMSDDAAKWYREKYNKHERELNAVIEAQTGIEQRLRLLESDLHVCDMASTMNAKLVKEREVVLRASGNAMIQAVTETANKEHHYLTEASNKLNASLYAAKSLGGAIQSQEAHINEMKLQEEALELLVKATSPTEGVVAEQLELFIAHFVGNMNAVISDIWSNNLRIHPCTLEDGELSFKFPLSFDDDNDTTKDISASSTGESQIINFAFRLVVMEYLGLTNYPLYIDEIGANFDERHRPNLLRYIKRVSENGQYSQLFVISHYIAQHGALTNSEVCALSTDGVALPERYNEHVEIE